MDRADQYLQQENPICQEVANIKDKLEFALFRLQTNMKEICSVGTKDDFEQAQNLFFENSERCKIILENCEKFLSKLDDDIRSQISDHAFDELYGDVLKKPNELSSKRSSKSGDSNNSEVQKLIALQIENRAKRNIDLLKQRQNLEIAEAKEKYLRAVEDRQISETDKIYVSNSILKGITTNKINTILLFIIIY